MITPSFRVALYLLRTSRGLPASLGQPDAVHIRDQTHSEEIQNIAVLPQTSPSNGIGLKHSIDICSHLLTRLANVEEIAKDVYMEMWNQNRHLFEHKNDATNDLKIFNDQTNQAKGSPNNLRKTLGHHMLTDIIKGVRHHQSKEDHISGRVKKRIAISAMDARSLPQYMIEYCTQDVLMLPALYDYYPRHPLYSMEGNDKIAKETEKRLEQSLAVEKGCEGATCCLAS